MEHSLQNQQIQKMMPQTMHSLQLLSMPIFSLKMYLGNIVLDNPYLELCYDTLETPASFDMIRDGSPSQDPASSENDAGASHPPSPTARTLTLQEQWFAREESSLYEHLRFQTEFCSFSPQEAILAEYLISNINSAGYLEESLDAAAAATGYSLELAGHVLKVIQTFTPCGIGARSLSECLILQVDTNIKDYGILRQILQEDLPPLAARQFSFLERKYKISRPRIQKILDYLQTLDPKPGSCFSPDLFTPYILPDVAVSLSGQQPEIMIYGETSTLLSFNPDYMKDVTDPEASEFLKKKKVEASSLIGSLNMRHSALQMLVSYLVAEQHPFFTDGPEALRPMTQKQAAAALGMNPSTICRCIREKYISTPWGTFPFNHFFSNKLNDSDCPAEVARNAVSTLIAGEDKSAPLCDTDIVGQLAEKGIHISRRTVAKYRSQLGIGGQSARIRYV
jgi:RNA polymerase sigma-54 factor